MCYYGQHRPKSNSLRIQDKIDNLKLVTERLRQNGNKYDNSANFNNSMAKLGLQ